MPPSANGTTAWGIVESVKTHAVEPASASLTQCSWQLPVTSVGFTEPPPVAEPPPVLAVPPPDDEPPPVAEPPPLPPPVIDESTMHEPVVAKHDSRAPHDLQVAPARPQAFVAVPAWHWPSAEQQPLHVEALHTLVLGEHATDPTASDKTSRTFSFMAVTRPPMRPAGAASAVT